MQKILSFSILKLSHTVKKIYKYDIPVFSTSCFKVIKNHKINSKDKLKVIKKTQVHTALKSENTSVHKFITLFYNKEGTNSRTQVHTAPEKFIENN